MSYENAMNPLLFSFESQHSLTLHWTCRAGFPSKRVQEMRNIPLYAHLLIYKFYTCTAEAQIFLSTHQWVILSTPLWRRLL